jgi:hypothetical protein
MLDLWLRGIGGSVVVDVRGKSRQLQGATTCLQETRWTWKKNTAMIRKAMILRQPDRRCLVAHHGRTLLLWNEDSRHLARKRQTKMRRKRHETGGSASSTVICDYRGRKSALGATRSDLCGLHLLVHWSFKLCSTPCKSLATFRQFLWILGDIQTRLMWIC